uniref:Copia protein n=1 Tax=Tanacetum cinerariifolium TaxID=118510 RepID=A0A6L2JER6_TANCI|nr:copia protein [Tanacetum cinerariifolium]
MQEELLQFNLQEVWTLMDLPYGKRVIGHTQEEGIDYDEVFDPVARIEAIRLFLAYASFKDFMVYQMDVKSAFLYEKIKEEVYVCQPLGFEDTKFLDKVYKVEKALYGLHQAPRAWEAQLQALVDGKKVIITDSTIIRDLQLEDAEGVDCLTNISFFKQLTLMGFVQVFLNGQLEEMSNHIRINVTPSHTYKIFRNMKRERKGLFGKGTSLFPSMMVQAQEDMGKDEAINEEMDDSLEKATTTSTSLDVERDRGNISNAQSKETPNEPGSQGTSSSGGPRVLDLETIKTTQALEIDSLKRRVKKLERRKKSRTHGLKRLYKVGLSTSVESFTDEGLGEEDASKQGRIVDIDANQDIYLVNVYKDKDMFGVNGSYGNDVIVEDAEMLFDVADDLRELKSAKPKAATTTAATTITATSSRSKAKGIVIHDQEQAPTPTVSSQQSSQVKDKGKGKMVKQEHVKKFSKKDEQDALTDAEKTKLFMEFLEKRRKFFAAKRADEKRNRPPTKAQQRSIMSIYLKNMDGWKIRSLKKKSFDKIQELFDKAMKRVNNFVDFKTELVEESSKKAKADITQEGSLKRTGDDLEQERSKKQKVEDDKESKKLKKYLGIIPDDGDESFFSFKRSAAHNHIMENEAWENGTNLEVRDALIGKRLSLDQTFQSVLGLHGYIRTRINTKRRDAAYLQTQLLIAQKEEAKIQLQAEEFDLMAVAVDLDETEKVNANCILMVNLQQALTSGTQTDKAPEQYTELLELIPKPHQAPQNDSNVISEVSCVEQGDGTIEEHPATIEETPKFVQDFKSLTKEADESVVKHKALELEIEHLLRIVASQDSMPVVQNNSIVDTLNLQTELEGLPKIDESHALSKPVTSISVPTPKESKVMKNDNVISSRIFRINPFKASRIDNFVPSKHVKASVKTKSIIISQPYVITKNDVHSKTNCFSPKDVKSTTRLIVSLLKTLKAQLGPEDHSLGTILRMIRSLLSLKVVGSQII